MPEKAQMKKSTSKHYVTLILELVFSSCICWACGYYE